MGLKAYASTASAPSRRSGGVRTLHWGWLAAVAGAHAAGLLALAGIDGTMRTASVPAQVPAVMVEMVAPATAPQPEPAASASPRVAEEPTKAQPPVRRPPHVKPAPAAPAAKAAVTPPAPAPVAHAPAASLSPPAPPPAPPTDGQPAPTTEDAPRAALARPSAPQAASGNEVPATSAARYDPAYLDNPAPEYPRVSRRRGEEGQVLLRVRVLKNGRAETVEVFASSRHPRLDEAAREAVRGWRFVPARQGDEAVDSWLKVPIVFRLEE